MLAKPRCRFWLAVAGVFLSAWDASAQRINHEGRILGPLPVVTNAVLFNTPQSDAIVSAMQIFPVTHAWNEDVANRPLLPNSAAMISQIASDLAANRRQLRGFYEMNFVVVPDAQPLVGIGFDLPPESYPDESDPGPYPIPPNMPVEGWPRLTGPLTLTQWQQDLNNDGGDRHAIIVQPGSGSLWEMWRAQFTNNAWHGANGAKWNLNSNGLRPLGWTSADAAGLPMLGGLVRYDECQRGMVEHACRIVVARTRTEFIYPATHQAGSTSSTNTPAMGQRLRLRSDFLIPETWSVAEQAVLKALKKYGALVSDNGNFFSISIVPDDRWAANEFANLANVGITNFEVIQTTGPTEGPRSPGAPVAFAGTDRMVAPGDPVNLDGFVSFSGAPPAILWRLYSGPTNIVFGNVTQTNATATFNVPGVYTLTLSASNGIHAVTYDAVVVAATSVITLAIAHAGTNLDLTWNGGAPPYVIERTTSLPPAAWSGVATTSVQSASVLAIEVKGFFRVRGN